MRTIKFISWSVTIAAISIGLSLSSFECTTSKESKMLSEISNKTLLNLHVKHAAGIVYLDWVTENEVADGLFLVERSINGEKYLPVGFISSIKNTSDRTAHYSYADYIDNDNRVAYRIVRWYPQGSYYYSKPV